MNLPSWKDGEKVLNDFSRISNLIQKEDYLDSDKQEMLNIMNRNTGLATKGESKYILLNEIRGKFLKKKQRNRPAEILANGRKEWIGWFELKHETVKETAIENTARVIKEINADVFCIIEAENRITANRFSKLVIPKIGGQEYNHIMVIDGNDNRGIDVGIMTRQSFDIQSIVTHVDDVDTQGKIFSRDCIEFNIKTALGNTLLILVNHFKSKGFGLQTDNNNKRRRQAKRVREIYDQRLNQAFEFIAVVGDLNDTPESEPLQPLLGNGSDLTDIMKHDKFTGDGRPGTHLNGTKGTKLDYILMSPKLTNKVIQGGIERRGVWGGIHGKLFPHFPEIKTAKDAASDHAALWADINL
ncbi:MAG TPA: endonuclease/exonuclease/phosphatase family protein [Nitrososphaeraceae archaeon]|nr:endonuclease/exonuclease/phosphatase family protein [Nitrososphaeraceae archaeon]